VLRFVVEHVFAKLGHGSDNAHAGLQGQRRAAHGARTWAAPPPGAWLYDIEIAPEQRGKGYGRGLLAALERQLASLRVESLGLNVFADNPVARRLYESSGYDVTTQNMTKTLE